MGNNPHGTEQLANSADSRGFAAPNSPGSAQPSVKELRDRVVSIVRVAATHIIGRRVELDFDGVLASSETRSSAMGLIIIADHEFEEPIRSLIKAFSSLDHILGEEDGLDGGAGSQTQTTDVPEPMTWIVNPTDGTANPLYGLPNFIVNIVCVVGDEVVMGAVANIYSGEIYCAVKGKDVQVSRQDDTVQVLGCSPTTELEKTLVTTGFSYSVNLRQVRGRIASQLLGGCRDTRRTGLAVLDLCMATHGCVDAYYKHDIKTWDYTAGALAATETGARIRALGSSERANAAGRPEGDPLNFGVGVVNPEAADAFYEALDDVISKVKNQCVSLGAGARV